MQLIEKKELMMGRRGPVAGLLAGAAMGLLGIGRLNRLYASTRDGGRDCAAQLLRRIGASYAVCDKDRSNVPAGGGVIFVANHPTGMLDGIVLIDLLGGIRSDVKFMGNFLLDRIESLKDRFIAVDPFDGADARRNTKGIREAMAHVAGGGALVIFPAGEVATWQRGFGRLRDRSWGRSVVRFIRRCGVPVVPVCIEARNSLIFHLAGKIHPRLRTALLPHELLDKRGTEVNVNIGSPVTPRMAAELPDMKTYGDYLRANVEYLHRKQRRRIRIIPRRRAVPKEVEPIADPVPVEELAGELAAIASSGHLLFTHLDYEVYCAHPDLIPRVMHEIGRLREVTFRGVGEGTMRSTDTDRYDEYYHQLFIWDRAAGAIVGAYRLGMGDGIVPRYGLRGFYVDSLFRMKPQMAPVMERTIELGRSFIVREYQRKPVSLLLLWRGILHVLLQHEQYRYLLGPVTISGELDKYSKTILVTHLRQRHFDTRHSRRVRPLTGARGIDAPIDPSLIEGVESIDLIYKLVRDIERDEMPLPVLIRKYLELNSRVLAFNVDHDFSDALDALMLLDLKKVPEKTIALLSKELSGIDVLARFREL